MPFSAIKIIEQQTLKIYFYYTSSVRHGRYQAAKTDVYLIKVDCDASAKEMSLEVTYEFMTFITEK